MALKCLTRNGGERVEKMLSESSGQEQAIERYDRITNKNDTNNRNMGYFGTLASVSPRCIFLS